MSSKQILETLKASNLTFLKNLEELLKFLSMRKPTQSLIDVIEKSLETGDNISSMKDLETMLGRPAYKNLVKGFEF